MRRIYSFFLTVLLFGFTIFASFATHGLVKIDPIGNQVHLNLTGNHSEMGIMWVTKSNTDCGRVEYGITKDNYNFSVDAECINHKEGAWWQKKWNGKIHSAKLMDLIPQTTYYYKIISDEIIAENSFKSSFDAPQRFSFGVFGDQGISLRAESVISKVLTSNLDLLLVVGDLSYAYTSSEVWDNWFNLIEPIVCQVPLIPAYGNHDKDFGFQAYEKRLNFPKSSTLDTDFFNSVNFGSVHFITLSSEHSLSEGSEQYKWLEADLEAASLNRDLVPWIVLQIHEPLYSTSENHGSNLKIRQSIEPLIQKYGVDLVFSGHDHNYERTLQVFDNDVVENGTVYILVGTGGRSLHGWDDAAPWTAKRISRYGFVKVDVTNNTMDIMFISNSGAILDTFSISN